ncbi:Protein kinase [Entamoeba marina]
MSVTYEAIDNIIKEGIVVKQGHIIKNWLDRWIVLTKEYLYYFDERAGKLRGIIPLEFATVKLCDIPDHPFAFELFSPSQDKTYFMEALSSDDTLAWINAITDVAAISEPTGYEHITHVAYEEGGFTGIPEEYENMFLQCGITKDEIKSNKEDAIKVMEFTQIFQDDDSNHPPTQPLPDYELPTLLKELISPGDPNEMYVNYTLIGEGMSGIVYHCNEASTQKEVAMKKLK